MTFEIPRSEKLGVALLIDGENMPSTFAGKIIVNAGREGELMIKRVYGNAVAIPKWQQAPGFRLINTGAGKNSADIMLAIQAVEFARDGIIKCFVIASSDGDFSHLAHYLREKAFRVVGIGEAKAPESFRKSCSEFIEVGPAATKATKKATVEEVDVDQLVSQIIEDNSDERGISLSALGSKMYSLHKIKKSSLPEKDWRKYLSARPDQFECDPKDLGACVRSKNRQLA